MSSCIISHIVTVNFHIWLILELLFLFFPYSNSSKGLSKGNNTLSPRLSILVKENLSKCFLECLRVILLIRVFSLGIDLDKLLSLIYFLRMMEEILVMLK